MLLAVRVVEVMDGGLRCHLALLVAHGNTALSKSSLLSSDCHVATEEILLLAGSLVIVLTVLSVRSSIAARVV